jgi:alpha,alpha-trehalase
MPLRTSPAAAHAAFASLPVDPASRLPPKAALAAYVDAHFGPPGSDYEAFTPPDIAAGPPPAFLPGVGDEAVRAAAVRVHALWPALCRRPAPSSSEGGDPAPTSTLLPTPGWAVVPGDRFRESYAWDGHWTVRGLVASGCLPTAAAVFGTLVALAAGSPHGEVPNGARTYYRNRSQPPLLAPTGAALLAAGDAAARAAVLASLHTLRAERAAWDAPHRVVRVGVSGSAGSGGVAGSHSLARYCARWGRPRPEAYREDVDAAVDAGVLSPADAQAGAFGDDPDHPAADLWRGLATAAESGWDFSTRWAAGGLPGGVGHGTPSPRCCAAHRVIPVDLNAFLIRSDAALAALCRAAGLEAEAAAHECAAQARRAAVDAVLWCAATGRWRDVVLPAEAPAAGAVATLTHAPGTYASSWVPLWAGCGRCGAATTPPLWPAAVASLATSGLVGPGGVATSLAAGSGEQWDGPNAWPPLQALLADGLADVSGWAACAAAETAGALAEEIATGFIANALAGLAAEGTLREKYCASTADGTPGEGGEYATQAGFGWTNGVVLSLLRRFGWPASAARARAAGENGG